MKRVSAKVTSKGQITLPAKLRDRLGIKPGDRLDFIERDKGTFEIVARRKTFADLRGIVPYDGPRLSAADILAMVEDARVARADTALEPLAKARK